MLGFKVVRNVHMLINISSITLSEIVRFYVKVAISKYGIIERNRKNHLKIFSTEAVYI